MICWGRGPAAPPTNYVPVLFLDRSQTVFPGTTAKKAEELQDAVAQYPEAP